MQNTFSQNVIFASLSQSIYGEETEVEIANTNLENFSGFGGRLEIYCPGGAMEEEILTEINFVQREEGRGIGLKKIGPSKREKKRRVKQVRKGVRSPVR